LSGLFRLPNFHDGGLLGYGAYIGGLIGASLACRGAAYSLRNWLDMATLPVLLGTGLTRLGCYMQGCDFGRPLGRNRPAFLNALGAFPRWKLGPDGAIEGSPAWISQVLRNGLPPDSSKSLPVHPTQLYAAVFAFALATLFWLVLRRRRFAGQLFLSATFLFSIGIFALEFLRGDADRGTWSIARSYEILNLGSWTQLMALGSVLLVVRAWPAWRAASQVAVL
jgi:phosphatidylglycerol:prolipoprotein diacylglycerol transferase